MIGGISLLSCCIATLAVVVVNVGEKELELTDMITKDGKLRRKKAKKLMSSEEIKEKLRKLRGTPAPQ